MYSDLQNLISLIQMFIIYKGENKIAAGAIASKSFISVYISNKRIRKSGINTKYILI